VTTRIHNPDQATSLPAYVDLTATGNTVTVRASNDLMAGTAEVDRAEFLAAVATELDVIVIPRTDLPEVVLTERGGLVAQTDTEIAAGINPASNWTAADARLQALGWLALAEHLENNTPIDEAAVDDLANVIRDTNLGHRLTMGDVRALVRAGVRVDGAR